MTDICFGVSWDEIRELGVLITILGNCYLSYMGIVFANSKRFRPMSQVTKYLKTGCLDNDSHRSLI